MEESLHDAVQEVKRVDHLVHVSLSYTRTVDVIRSIIERVISSFDCAILALMDNSSEHPQSPGLRVAALKDSMKDNEELQEYLDFYLWLRKVIRAPYDKRREYRRHVTMISHLDDGDAEINIDLLKEYYDKTKKFLMLVKDLTENGDS